MENPESLDFDFIREHQAHQIMTSPVVCATPNASAEEIKKRFLESGCSGMPIVNQDNRVTGLVSQYDILQLIYKNVDLETIPAHKFMTRNVITADKNALLAALVKTFLEKRINRIPITDQGTLVGIVTRQDILSHLALHRPHFFQL
ncbi:MAG: HPP family protein [Nitrospinaceae bacterium]